jgi:hypothetical protein
VLPKFGLVWFSTTFCWTLNLNLLLKAEPEPTIKGWTWTWTWTGPARTGSGSSAQVQNPVRTCEPVIYSFFKSMYRTKNI